MMEGQKKIKVLHLIDGLGGGGSEEWVKEIVRLSDKERFTFVVARIVRGTEGRFSYRDEIENLGVRVIDLEGDAPDSTRGGIDREVSFIRDVMGHRSGAGFAQALGRTVKYSIENGKIGNLARLTLDALRLLINMSIIVRREGADIIHTHLFYAFMFGGLTGKILRIPVVYSVPAMKSQLDISHPWVFPMFGRFGFLVDVFMTGIGKEELVDHGGVSPDKIVFFRGSIDLETVINKSKDVNPVMKEYNLQDSYPILLSVGRFDPSKGHEYSLEAVRLLRERFPSVKLIILGEGKDHDRFKNRVRDDELLGDSVILPGFVENPSDFYSAADIYLRTTLFEGMNRASYLAMAYSKPVIGFDTEAPTEAVVDGRNGLLVPTGDVGGLVSAIEKLAEDRELQKTMGDNARRYIEEQQNILDAIRTFERVYLKLVSERGAGKRLCD